MVVTICPWFTGRETKMLSDLPKVTQLLRDGTRIYIHIVTICYCGIMYLLLPQWPWDAYKQISSD